MLEDTTIHNAITDKALASYFRSSGNLLEEESAVLGQAVTNLMLSGDNVNNKNIILSLIHSLETTSDILKADVLRTTLAIVFRSTADDMITSNYYVSFYRQVIHLIVICRFRLYTAYFYWVNISTRLT